MGGAPAAGPFGVISSIAPRPVLISSSAEDLWADPKGEFLAARGAIPSIACSAPTVWPSLAGPSPRLPRWSKAPSAIASALASTTSPPTTGTPTWTSRTITSKSRRNFEGPQLLIRSSGRAYCQCSGLPLPTPDLSIHEFNRRVPGFQGLQLVRLLRPLERCQEGQDGVRVDGLDQMVVEARLA